MNSWQEVVDFLDSNVNEWDCPREQLSILSPKNMVNESDDGREKVAWEYVALSFWFSDGELNPIGSQTSADGLTVVAFPNFDHFSDATYAYLHSRAEQTHNLFLKARYFAILWNAPKQFKRNENGIKAIDALLSILLNCDSIQTQDMFEALGIFKIAARISSQIKRYRADEIAKLAESWLFLTSHENRHFKVAIIKFMTECPKIWFPIGLRSEHHDLLLQIMDEFIVQPDSFFGKEAGLLGVKLASKLGLDQKIWFNKIGEIFEAFAESRLDDESRIVPLSQLQEAMIFYKKAGNSVKIEQVGQKYQSLKGELKLSNVRVPVDYDVANAIWDFNSKLSDSVVRMTSDEIFDYLAVSERIFPRAVQIKSSIKNRQFSFDNFAKRLKFDRNKNLDGLNQTEQEREKEKFFGQYGMYVGMQVLPLISMIFSKGILNGKINHNTLIQYLADHTWLGQNLEETNSAGEIRGYSWLGLLAPAILEYFFQKEASLKSANAYTNYVLCIDSLTLKFEGILRESARILGANTLKTGRDGQMRECFIEDLLELNEIKNHFSEDDLHYFRYIFTGNGLNLRNDIAHCFFRFSDYNEDQFLLVLTAILRFAKYRIEPVVTQ